MCHYALKYFVKDVKIGRSLHKKVFSENTAPAI